MFCQQDQDQKRTKDNNAAAEEEGKFKRPIGLGWIRHEARNGRNSFKARRVKQKLSKAGWRFERKHGAVSPRTGLLGRHRNNKQAFYPKRTSESYCETVVSEDYTTPKKNPQPEIPQHSEAPQELAGLANYTITTVPTKTFSAISAADVNCDHIRITPILNMPYAHGGYFGAAPLMLSDPVWVAILRELMPDVYVEVARRVNFARNSKLMHWAENNPVVAAFATMHENENDTARLLGIAGSSTSTPLEWDVFLDPRLVKRLLKALDDLELFEQRCREERTNTNTHRRRRSEHASRIFSRNTSRRNTLNHSVNNAREAERTRLKEQVHRQTTLLLEKMLIAHGSLSQIILEQSGTFQQFNFKSVKRQRRTVGGGISAREWLAVYARALLLGLDPSSILFPEGMAKDDQKQKYSEGNKVVEESCGCCEPCAGHATSNPEQQTPQHPLRKFPTGKQVCAVAASSIHNLRTKVLVEGCCNNSTNNVVSSRLPSFCNEADCFLSSLHLNFNPISRMAKRATSLRSAGSCPLTTMEESLEVVKRITGSKLRLVLDVKSRYVPKKIWALVVDALRERGAGVDGIASFTPSEIRGISDLCLEPVKQIFFFHSAGDMQRACHKELQPNDTVFFNAGSLLSHGCPNKKKNKKKRKTKSKTRSKRKQTQQQQKLINYGSVKSTLSACWKRFDPELTKESYTLQPFATSSSASLLHEFDAEGCGSRRSHHHVEEHLSTIADYKQHYKLNIGLYSQEFAVDERAIDLLVQFVNANDHVFNLGLSWGGLNGYTIQGIQPRRFHRTDGLWNQRYVGMKWDGRLKPGDIFVEDHDHES